MTGDHIVGPECKLFIGCRYKRHNSTWESWHANIGPDGRRKEGRLAREKEYVRGKREEKFWIKIDAQKGMDINR